MMMRRSGTRRDKWSWVTRIICQRRRWFRLNFDDSLCQPKHCCNLYSIKEGGCRTKAWLVSVDEVGEGGMSVKVDREGEFGWGAEGVGLHLLSGPISGLEGTIP